MVISQWYVSISALADLLPVLFFSFPGYFFLKCPQTEEGWTGIQSIREADRAWLYLKASILPSDDCCCDYGPSLHREVLLVSESRQHLLGEGCYHAPMQDNFLLL